MFMVRGEEGGRKLKREDDSHEGCAPVPPVVQNPEGHRTHAATEFEGEPMY